jgi:AmmeMemoRadiSam system protein A
MSLTSETRDFLIGLARRSIRRGLAAPDAGVPELADCPPEALAERACFVTLTTGADELRGCRGTIDAHRTLAADVWHNAWASAFDDPRFSPVTAAHLQDLVIDISVLSPLEPVKVSSEEELRQKLVPRCDGLVLAWRGRRATFLPKVWELLPEPGDFLAHLKAKAGLPRAFWARDIEIYRYRVE